MKLPKIRPLKQIRKFCLECCGNSYTAIEFCGSTDCPLWFLRFGTNPKTLIKRKGDTYSQLFDKKLFKTGGKFCPSTNVYDLEL
jgi:hypothetical protein